MQVFQRELIPRHDDEPYLERLIIFKCKYFGIFLHRFVGGDDECSMHNHPWPFLTWILKGGYDEYVVGPDGYGPPKCTWYGVGSLLARPAEWTHQVQIRPNTPTVSLVIHGFKRQHWGFFTPKGFVGWRNYSYRKLCLDD